MVQSKGNSLLFFAHADVYKEKNLSLSPMTFIPEIPTY